MTALVTWSHDCNSHGDLHRFQSLGQWPMWEVSLGFLLFFRWCQHTGFYQLLPQNDFWVASVLYAQHFSFSRAKNWQPVQNPTTFYCPQSYPPPILSHSMHTLPLFYPSPCMTSRISSHLMHALPLFYPRPCTPSYSIPPHACSLPILSHSMHALPLFYPSPCTPSPYSIPAHALPPPIIFHPMQSLSLFYPTLCMPSSYSFPANTSHPSMLFYSSHCLSSKLLVAYTSKACFSFDIWHLLNLLICSHSVYMYHHHLPSLVIWSINLWHQVLNVCCFHSHNSPYELLVHVRSIVNLHIYVT